MTQTGSAAAVELPARAKRLAGRYELIDELGSGGMGAVYRVKDHTTGRIVAFKQLLSTLAGTKRAKIEALFEREYHTLVRLKHPRIIEVYEYGVTEEGPYYTMELLDGQDLLKLAPLPYQEACRHLRDIASSLALVHAQRLVHRDVSPRNVRLTKEGRAKLIDFGALTPFGLAHEIVGTPVVVAPEVMRDQPVDQRTDMFALGSLAYWALTRRYAYPARTLGELPEAWERSPTPPSKLVPGIPPALDDLVMSLLSLDPMARPANSAAVIDQLTAIGGLEPEENEHGDSYLSSSRMVGRSGEMRWLGRRVSRALEGRGAQVVIEGTAGIGKTRLLLEAGLDAQLKGMLVLTADARANPGPFGLAAALAVKLLVASPEAATTAAAPHASLLGHLSTELWEKLNQPKLEPLARDPGERRARFQTALHNWFVSLAKQKPMLLAADNVHAADDSSVAFLAALGRTIQDTGIVILVSQRSGSHVAAPASLKNLRRRGGNLKLAGLNASACQELVKSLFGDVANTGRLAKLLFERSGGNPQHCMDLAHLLVKKESAKYVGGTWVLPLTISAEDLPSRAEEIAAVKLSGLSSVARQLAESLSVHTKPVSIEQCLSLSSSGDDGKTYQALDELVAEQVLLAEGGNYRFGQQSLREAVLQQMNEATRQRHHRCAAETILESADQSVGARVEAAFHLLHAGDEGRGADVMAAAGREFLRNENVNESPERVVQALHAALGVYEKQARSDHEIAGLLFPLIALAFHVDGKLTLEYAERALLLGLKITGLGLARRLRPFLGKKVALIVGLLAANVAFSRQKKRGLTTFGLKDAIASFVGIVPAAVGTHNICYNIATVERLTALLEPLAYFGEQHVAALMRQFAVAQLRMGQGREFEAKLILEDLAKRFESPHVIETLGEGHFKSIFGGILFSLGVLYPYQFGSATSDTTKRLEALGIRLWAMGADQVRLLYHALRGESEEVARFRERVEFFAVQGSTTWQAEHFWPVLLLTGDVMAGDTIATRRGYEQLARRAKESPSLHVYAEAAHAAYLTLRGDPRGALVIYERVLPELGPRSRVAWSSIRAFYADALNRSGEHARARDVVREVLEQSSADERSMVGRFLEPQRQLAIAEAGLGNHAEAMKIVDGLLAEWKGEDNPLLLGLVHKTAAEVATALGDDERVAGELREVERLFRSTRNPALFAQWERLAEKQAGASLSPSGAPEGTWETLRPALGRGLSELSAAVDPYDYALKLILERTQARAGYLYLLEDNSIRLVAATSPNEPPPGLETQLSKDIARCTFEVEEESPSGSLESRIRQTTEFVESQRPPMPVGSHELVPLCTNHGRNRLPLGGVILEVGASPQRLDQGFAGAVASVLADLLVATQTTFQ